jgi:hypothetical protein
VTLNHWVVGSIPTRCKPLSPRKTLDPERVMKNDVRT